MDSTLSRNRLHGSGDHDNLISDSLLQDDYDNNANGNNNRLKQLSNYFSSNIFFDDEWHSEDYLYNTYDDSRVGDSSWRLKEKMKETEWVNNDMEFKIKEAIEKKVVFR